MSRFPSLSYAPGETREILRDRFSRKLRVLRQALIHNPNLDVTADQLVLRLLSGLTILPSAAWSTAQGTYAMAAPTGGEPPDLQALANLGWLRRIWGRVEIGRDLRVAVTRTPAGALDAFKVLLSRIHEQRYEVSDTICSDPGLTDLADAIVTRRTDPATIVSRTPEWVAARLWEMALKQEPSPDDALRRWVDLWTLLRHPSLVPTTVWSGSDANAFKDAVFRTIASEPALGNWTTTRDRYARQAELAHKVTVSPTDPRFPPPPDTLVGRALWVQAYPTQDGVYDSLEICGDLFGPVRLLLEDVEAADNVPAPHPVVAMLVDLAIDRAELFIAMLFQAQGRPKLLADLALHPPSAALSCLLIAQWRSPVGAWERNLVERDHQVGQTEAFADAVAILGEHLRTDKAKPSEAAALLNWLHYRGGIGFVDDVASADSLITALRRELANCAGPTLLAMAYSLHGPDFREGVGTSEFATVLDLSDLGGLDDQIDADVVIASYVDSIARGEYSLSAHRIGAANAASLARIANRTKELRARFLHPLDIRARFAAAEDNEISLAESIGRSLRAHMRILARAIIGGAADVPTDLFDALVATVRAGALKHKEKGRVAAFAPRFERQIGVSAYDRPLAADLAAALTFVDRQRQDTLLTAILETDEPLILAQLLTRSPPHLRLRIKQRISALAPTDAGAIHSLPEMQARIDELLTAGAVEAAESYMAAEAGLKTLGNPPGRELTRFQNRLRLLFLRRDWAALAAEPHPSFQSSMDQAAAVDALRQFRALEALTGPNPNPEFAKNVFADLFAKRPSPALATNWFAAEISGLLQADSFGLLKANEARRGHKALVEAKQMMAKLPSGSVEEAMECNRALLLLALGEPGQALAVLSNTALVRLQDGAAAYRAIALSRLGRLSEATGALDAAEHAFGRTAVLTAARTHIASGAAYLSAPDVSVHDDLLENVSSAIARFRSMNPADQAKVLHPQGDSFEALLLEHVRAATDAIVSLVPMMEVIEIDASEDDLTAFVQHLLAARVQYLGWSVHDQSRGGFSGKGNAGERDLVVAWGGTILALIEAVVCDRSLTHNVMKADLESHFQKLLGYGNPRIFFHLTYSYIEDLQGLMQFLEAAAETASPPGFTYIDRQPVPHGDSRPPGFVARYTADFGEVKVVFLVLNLGQKRQRNAAKTAAATKARKAPKGPDTRQHG
jgi:hypothetical protein